jgi:hypothetical protein
VIGNDAAAPHKLLKANLILMSGLGQKRTFHDVRVASALPPKADIRRQPFDVGFGPMLSKKGAFSSV